MPAPRPPLRVGLTGGIAAGKSTIAGMLADLGAAVIDADLLVHEALAPGGAAVDEIVACFGRGVLDPAGAIDRAVLGRLVFADASARADLERIVHPHVQAETARRTAELGRRGARIVVFDAALLVETGRYRELDRLVVVVCSRTTQLRRLRERGIDAAEAEARLAAQLPLVRKLGVADYIVSTEGPLDATREITARVWRWLLADLEREIP